MHQAAATADAKVLTFRIDPVCGRLMDLRSATFIIAFMQARVLEGNLFTGQRTVNKDGFAVNPGNAPAIVR
jgi:hypothetical protein